MEFYNITTITVPSYAPILPPQSGPVAASEQLSLPLLALDVATAAIAEPPTSKTPKKVRTDHLAKPTATAESVQVIAEPTGYSTYIFHKVDAATNCRRSYMIAYQPSFFNEHCLVRQWGRIGSTKQRIKHQEFENSEDALNAFKKAVRRRIKRGYVLLAS